ncbi:MAG: Ig-like domain-containing protein [Prevotella sp.]|nr:Ig-like domain-containing protein [Prevotella sp.]
MIKKRFISMLVLLMTAVTGAWAQEGTLLTTIYSTGWNEYFTSGSKTFGNCATVTFSDGVLNSGNDYGWHSGLTRTLTVTAAEGYTITRVKFYTYYGSAFDEEAPFEAILLENLNFVTIVNGTSIGSWGVTKIEVYGYAGTLVAVTGVTLAPTSATLTLGETVTLTATVLPDNATFKSVTWSSSNEAVATFINEGVVTAVRAGEATITFTATNGTVDTSDDKTATCTVTVAEPTRKVSVKEGTEDATSWQGKAGTGNYQALPLEGVAAGTAVSVKYNGTKKVKSVKAKKKVKAAAEATAEDKGKVIGIDGKIYTDVAAATAAGTTAVAKIIYLGPTGHATYSHGLALALTDEANRMVWQDAINACSAKNTSTPVTGATWLLASKDQWDYMMGTDGAGSYTALRDGFSGISGASNLQSDRFCDYWSSTEAGSNNAWSYFFGNGTWNDNEMKYRVEVVRACLAF